MCETNRELETIMQGQQVASRGDVHINGAAHMVCTSCIINKALPCFTA